MSQNINTVDISNDANLEDYVLVSVNGSLRRVKVANLKELVDSTEDVVVVDTELSTTSVNPVQNRVITTELNKKANSSDMTTYQTKRDNALTTTSKEVVGAINENTTSINQLSGGKADKIEVNELKEDLYNMQTREQFTLNGITLLASKTIDTTTGNIKGASWHSATGFYLVTKGDIIAYSGLKAWTNVNAAIIGLYNTNKEMISTIAANNATQSGSVTVEENGFVRFSSLTEVFPDNGGAASVTIVSKNTKDSTNYADGKIAIVEEKIKAQHPIEKPIYLKVDDRFGKNKTIGASAVGSAVVFSNNPYRNVFRLEISKVDKALMLLCSKGSNENVCAVVTNDNGIVLKAINSDSTNIEFVRVALHDVPNAKYVYWTALGDANTVAMYERGDYTISKGVKKPFTGTGYTLSAEMIDGETAWQYSVPDNGQIELSFDDSIGFTWGFWLKMPYYYDVRNTEKIIITAYYGNTTIKEVAASANFAQLNNWLLLKTAHIIYGGRKINKIVITFEIKDTYGEPVSVLISPFLVENHYQKPIYIINNDSFWGASERCGYYDYLINNRLPFSVTGVWNKDDEVSENMKQKLIAAHHNSLLDVGIYTNEQPIDHPISVAATSFIDVQNSMNHLIDTKIKDGFYPVSLSAGQHHITPAIKRSIEVSGFKCIRGGFSENGELIVDGMTSDVVYMSGNAKCAYESGGAILSFSHGVSANPSGEWMPSIYSDWSITKSGLDEVIAKRDRGEILVMNMKQYAEYRKAKLN